MKKIVSVLLSVALVVTLAFGVSIIASAESEDPTIVVSSGSTSRGGTKEITISVKNNPGIASLRLSVAFSSDLSLVSFGNDTYDGKYTDAKGDPAAEATNVTDWVKYNIVDNGGKGFVYQPQTSESPVTLNWVSPYENVTGDFTFATLKFKVADGAELGDKDITVTYDPGYIFNQSEEDVTFAIENGKITVSNVLKGDVNGDGKRNAQDVTFLRRHLAGGYNVTIVEANADIDGNGKVNAQDVTLLRRALAGGYGISLD